MLCPLYTPHAEVLRIVLTKPLPRSSSTGDPTRSAPWAVETAAGTWCTRVTGATGAIAGMGIDYDCRGGGILLGDPRRQRPTWTIFYAPGYRASTFTRVGLRAAWW